MFNFEYYFSFYIFFLSCVMFCFYNKHLLLMIISLEFMVISMIYNLFVIMMIIESNMYMNIYLMVFTVCEGALALSLIVMMVRLFGNDYINSMSVLKW